MKVLEASEVVIKLLESEGMVKEDQTIFDLEVQSEYREIDGKIKSYLCGWVAISSQGDDDEMNCSFTIDLNTNKVVGFDNM